MKKVLFIGLSIAAVLVAGAAAFFGFESKKETSEKKNNSSALKTAREKKALKKDLLPEAEALGIDPYGMSYDDLKAEIEFVKSNLTGTGNEQSGDNTEA